MASAVQNAEAITIPRNLSKTDRISVVRILGLSSSSKVLSVPYSLGGYDGLELGLSLESINTRNLNSLGDGAPDAKNTFQYTRFTIGKGLYNNFDLFLNAIPLSEGSSISGFGAALRYKFYESTFLPLNLSILTQLDHVNVNNKFECFNMGAHLIAGIFVNQISLFLGLGQNSAAASFIGGTGTDGTVNSSDPHLNSETNTVSHTLTEPHHFLGASLQVGSLFLVGQIDRYPEVTYSGKVGLRF